MIAGGHQPSARDAIGAIASDTVRRQTVDRPTLPVPCADTGVPTPECRAPGQPRAFVQPRRRTLPVLQYLRYKGKAAKAAELERVKGVEFARTLTTFKQMRNDELCSSLTSSRSGS